MPFARLRTSLFALTLVIGLSSGVLAQEVPKTEPKPEPKPEVKPAENPDVKLAPRPAPARPKIDFPAKGEFPTTMPVPAAAAGLGKVYQVADRSRVVWTSNAPAENIEGTSINVVGYAVAGDEANPGELKAGEWSVPVKSMRTGNPTRDGHLASADWLDSEKHPNITFKLKRVESINLVPATGGAKTDSKAKRYTATLIGDLSIHGVTKEVSVPDTNLHFIPEGNATALVAPGDLLAIKSKMKVNLAEYGVANDTIKVKQKVAENIEIRIDLICGSGDPGAPKADPKPAPKADVKSSGS